MRQKDQVITATERLQRRRAAAQGNGSEGGSKRAEYYGPEVLSEWAAKGGKAVLKKYGRGHFVELRKRHRTCAEDVQLQKDFEDAQAEARTMARRRNAQKAGLKRGKLYSAEQRSNWARKGGIATRARYGNDFYREIRKLRKRYRKGYLTRKTKERLREIFKRRAEDEAYSGVGALWNFLANKANTLTYPANCLLDDAIGRSRTRSRKSPKLRSSEAAAERT